MNTDYSAMPRVSAGQLPFRRLALALVTMPGTILLTICGGVSALIYYFAFTQRYSLAEDGAKPLQTIASLSNLSANGAFGYVGGFLALFGLYWLAFRRGLRPASKTHWLIVIGFAAVFVVALLPLYPVDAADIYDYILRGRMTTVYELNPMRDLPTQVRSDPFYGFASLRDLPSAYGPAWEILAAGGSKLAGDNPTANVIIFKLISVAGYAATAWLIALTLQALAPRRVFAGTFLFLWNPLALYMAAGNGHNDTVMMACVMLGFYCLVRRWYLGATLGMILGALVKFVPFILIPIVAIAALRELHGSQRLRYLVSAAVSGLLLMAVLYAPFWVGPQMIVGNFGYRTRMFTGSVATVARASFGPVLDGQAGEVGDTPKAATVVQYTVLLLFALYYLSQLWAAFKAPNLLGYIRAATCVLFGYLLLACTWFQPWYALWPLTCVALFDNTPIRRLAVYFSYLVTWQPFLYYFVTLRPGGWADQPWRDLIPVGAVMGITWGYIAWFWMSLWLRQAARSPFAVALGKRLCAARTDKGLSATDLADILDLRTDDLLGYERGDRPIPLPVALVIGEQLQMPIDRLLVETTR